MQLIATSSLLTLLWPALAVSDVQYEEQCLPTSVVTRIVVDADLMVATCSGQSGTTPKTPSASVYERTGSDWILQAVIEPTDLDPRSMFGDSAHLSGTTLIVGDQMDGNHAGCAYVFRHSDGVWIQEQKLIPSKGVSCKDDEQGTYYGNSVATDGTWALFGPRGGESGVCVFRHDGEQWVEVGYLMPDENVNAFGFSMDLDGDAVLIGSRGNMGGCCAYIYRLDGESWVEEAQLTLSSTEAIGGNVDLNGDLAIVGNAEMQDGEWTSSIAVVFRRIDGIWTEEEIPQSSEGVYFGGNVAISDSIALVRTANENWENSHHVFQHDGNSWIHTKTLVHSNGLSLGWGFALADDEALIVAVDEPTRSICLYPNLFIECNDVNGDNTIGLAELDAVLAHWGTNDDEADINGDKIVNILDLLAVLSGWGPCP